MILSLGKYFVESIFLQGYIGNVELSKWRIEKVIVIVFDIVVGFLLIAIRQAVVSALFIYSCLLLQSPVDGKPMLLTPEESIQIQVKFFG